MRITDHIDLFYPDRQARQSAQKRREEIRKSGTGFMSDLKVEGIKSLFSLSGGDMLLKLCEELCTDIDTINYRLDCLEDFINNPELRENLRRVVNELSHTYFTGHGDTDVNAFYEIKERSDFLLSYLDAIGRINDIYSRISGNIKSEAVRGLFEFFKALPQSEEFKNIDKDLSELKEIFSKTIRSVKVGINFDAAMIPDSAGLMEVSYDKIYPKGNVIERLVFGQVMGQECFEGEEHLSSLTRHAPADIDTALFRELSEYTAAYAKRISSALAGYQKSFFSDISELEHQLDFYEGAAMLVKNASVRGMKFCRPKLLPMEKRKTKLKGAFDLCLYKELVLKYPAQALKDRLMINDLTLDEKARIFMLTGANNGGKTTFARAAAVCQVLAQAGLFVPAEYAEVSVCDNVFTHFPKSEQTGIDTSRFTVEIKELKKIVVSMTSHSLVILNESLQSTTPEECMKIAAIHCELFASAGVRGIYVTHLTGLYNEFERINRKNYPSTLASLVSETDENEKRLYRITAQPPSGESLAMTIYRRFGATADDIRRA